MARPRRSWRGTIGSNVASAHVEAGSTVATVRTVAVLGLAIDPAVSNDPVGDELASRLRRDLQASLDTALGGRGKAKVVLGGAATP